MVRLGLIVMVLVLTGCSALGDAFSADTQVAGTAAGQTLTVDRLANVVGRAQRIPIRPDVLTGVANVYLDYAVFATELGRGRDLHDSALVLATRCALTAPARARARRGPDAVRVPHHSPAAAGRGARLVPRRSRELAHRPARLPAPGQPREPATAQDRVRRARPGAPGGSADRLRPERQPDPGHP